MAFTIQFALLIASCIHITQSKWQVSYNQKHCDKCLLKLTCIDLLISSV